MTMVVIIRKTFRKAFRKVFRQGFFNKFLAKPLAEPSAPGTSAPNKWGMRNAGSAGAFSMALRTTLNKKT